MSSSLAGRWDVMVGEGDSAFPSWFELVEGPEGWTGALVGMWGSARPIDTVQVEGDRLFFSLPNMYGGKFEAQTFEGVLAGGVISGQTNAPNDQVLPFVAKPAPRLPFREAAWGEPIDLLADGLNGWVLRTESMGNNWSIQPEGLVNSAAGSDIVTKAKFTDFKVLAEYSYPKDSNSGIYLRGRYEFQIIDDFGQEPGVGSSGAIYGFLKPSVNAIRPFGERNTVEITIIGRTITVVLNGTVIVDGQEVPGITGGALESFEGEPGPLFLQGDHGPVTFHRVVVTPAL